MVYKPRILLFILVISSINTSSTPHWVCLKHYRVKSQLDYQDALQVSVYIGVVTGLWPDFLIKLAQLCFVRGTSKDRYVLLRLWLPVLNHGLQKLYWCCWWFWRQWRCTSCYMKLSLQLDLIWGWLSQISANRGISLVMREACSPLWMHYADSDSLSSRSGCSPRSMKPAHCWWMDKAL